MLFLSGVCHSCKRCSLTSASCFKFILLYKSMATQETLWHLDYMRSVESVIFSWKRLLFPSDLSESLNSVESLFFLRCICWSTSQQAACIETKVNWLWDVFQAQQWMPAEERPPVAHATLRNLDRSWKSSQWFGPLDQFLRVCEVSSGENWLTELKAFV